MNDQEVNEKIEALKKNSTWFWTDQIRGKINMLESDDLQETLSDFKKMLQKNDRGIIVKKLLNSTTVKPKLAIQHLMLASDCSAEFLDRVKSYLIKDKHNDIKILTPDNRQIPYKFKKITKNPSQKLSKTYIVNADNELLNDVMTIIIFGAEITLFKNFSNFKKLSLCKIVGNIDKVNEYFDPLYLKTSRQTQGRISAQSGKNPQNLVKKKLDEYFEGNEDFSIVPGNRIPNIGKEAKGFQVDLAYKITGKSPTYIGIEIAFQETTNSVIERKSKQAAAIINEFNNKKYYLCFVVDGAGYFTRESAMKGTIKNSHKVVTFKQLNELCENDHF